MMKSSGPASSAVQPLEESIACVAASIINELQDSMLNLHLQKAAQVIHLIQSCQKQVNNDTAA